LLLANVLETGHLFTSQVLLYFTDVINFL